MPDRVFDTKFVAAANGPMTQSSRKQNNVLDRRLKHIEEFAIHQRVRARYNSKLLEEYEAKLLESRNDIIQLFLTKLADSQKCTFVKSNKLQRSDYAKCCDIGWPSHDQHLLAAAVNGEKVAICTTEQSHGVVGKQVYREFRIAVICIP